MNQTIYFIQTLLKYISNTCYQKGPFRGYRSAKTKNDDKLTIWNDQNIKSISKISIYHDNNQVYGLSTELVDFNDTQYNGVNCLNEEKVVQSSHNIPVSLLYTYKFQESEQITSLKGRSGQFTNRIEIQTNFRTIVAGGMGGMEYEVTDGNKIVDFQCGYGQHLDYLGVIQEYDECSVFNNKISIVFLTTLIILTSLAYFCQFGGYEDEKISVNENNEQIKSFEEVNIIIDE